MKGNKESKAADAEYDDVIRQRAGQRARRAKAVGVVAHPDEQVWGDVQTVHVSSVKVSMSAMPVLRFAIGRV